MVGEHQLDFSSEVNVGGNSSQVERMFEGESLGKVSLQFDGLEPSPVSKTSNPQFTLLSSVIRHHFGSDVIVSPALMTANTDTKFVWSLSDNIYRFMPFLMDNSENVHTVNENTKVESLVGTVGFYHELIRAF